MPNAEQSANYERIKRLGGEPVPADDQPYGIEIHTADGVYLKQIVIPKKGTILPQHTHHWDHTTMVAVGSVLVWINGRLDRRADAPTGILVRAGVRHAFQSAVDGTVLYCLHGLHSEQAQRVLKEYDLSEDDGA